MRVTGFDFCGWATKNNVRCSDGRIIRRGAFAHNDGMKVPLVWNHQHSDPSNVIGYALLEDRPEGTFTYGFLNDTQKGQDARLQLQHGDLTSLSIYANQLKQNGSNVVHGEIREVSLVLASANPEACIEDVITHSDDDESNKANIYMGEEECELMYSDYLFHDADGGEGGESDGDADGDDGDDGDDEYAEVDDDYDEYEDDDEDDEDDSDEDETDEFEDPDGDSLDEVLDTFDDKQMNVLEYITEAALQGEDVDVEDLEAFEDPDGDSMDEILDNMDDKQTNAMEYVVGQALAHSATLAHSADMEIGEILATFNDDQLDALKYLLKEAFEFNEGDSDMKHNLFEGDERTSDVLMHSDQEDIIELAKQTNVGSLQTALEIYAEENDMTLQHDAISSGFLQSNADGNVTWLFPEYKDLKPGAPELITNDQGWIGTVMGKVHKSPISRIRTGQVDIRNIDSLRARGYKKGKQKAQTGNFALVRRTTDPQTVYVKSALHRDDIVDITDFDYVQYLYNIDRLMLNEELATAIMLGDGRDVSDADKISPEHIRPIWTDDELYTKHYDLDLEAAAEELQGENTEGYFGANFIMAEAMVNKCLYAREQFKGSGTPDMFITPHMLNVMLLARDRNGRRIYSGKAELATALNVGNIYTAEQFANKTRVDGEGQNAKTKELLAIIVNLADYQLGATKGGEITHFTQFDIDFNQQKSLLETRVSGALTRVYSAIAIEKDVTVTSQQPAG